MTRDPIACVGAGLIGAGWAAAFMAHGHDVRLFDPDPMSRASARERVEANVKRMGRADHPHGRLTTVADIEAALDGCCHVQESGPEDIAVKRALLAQIDAASPVRVTIGSSTSAFPVDEMLSPDMRYPERIVVIHPLNPVYLIPLVEVACGCGTSDAALAQAMTLMHAIGKEPLLLTNAAKGFIVNRLQETLWREALHLVLTGAATPEQIDQAISRGLAPRWTAVGPFQSYHLAYAGHGIRELLEAGGTHDGWSRLEVARPSPADIGDIADAVRLLLAQRLGDAPVDRRDAMIAAVLQSLGESVAA